ncbi:M20/M25/M40 family metallo-hydrolase [Candidatus Poribacteria bacterium]|nr:M20/M25/M40 family metallo-hydrolase [Candidatus Poribacteria bacterium]
MRQRRSHCVWRCLFAILLFLPLSISAVASQRAFYRIPSADDAALTRLPTGSRVRHRSDGWALVEIPAEAHARLPYRSEFVALVRADRDYYWVGGLRGAPSGVEVLLTSGDYALVSTPIGEEWRLDGATAPHAHVVLEPMVRAVGSAVGRAPAAVPTLGREALLDDVAGSFDADRWFRHIETLADNDGTHSRYSRRVRQATHHNGHPPPDDAADRAADWIADQLRSYGYAVEDDPFRHLLYATDGDLLAEYRMRNVVATKPGTGFHRNRTLVLTAHYDSKATNTEGWEDQWRDRPAPGANDNATGVATLLEAARVFADKPFDYSIRFAFFSGEELGLFGSRHYAKAARDRNDDLLGVLNVDMLGYDADGVYDLHVIGDRNSEWMLHAVEALSRRYGNRLDVQPERDPDWVFSDHAPFWAQGYSGISFAEETDFESSEFYPQYHSEDDLPVHVTRAYGVEAARFVLVVAAEIGGVLVPEGPPSGGDGVQVFGASAFPNPYVVGGSRPLRIQYQLNRPADVRVEVYDVRGARLLTQEYAADSPFGRSGLNAPIIWDGRDAQGEPVPTGLYFVRIRASDESGSALDRALRLHVVPSEAYLSKPKSRISPNP